MNEPKYTPGPWEISRHASPEHAPQFGIYSGFENDLAIVKGNRANANAHLIAAAPELLKALQSCDRVFGAPNPDPVAAFATIEKARAAISKALGDA